jgi:hypothetical protein
MLDYWLKYTDLVQTGQAILSGRHPRFPRDDPPSVIKLLAVILLVEPFPLFDRALK